MNNPLYTSLPKRTQGHLQSLYKSEEQIAIESLNQLEVDAISKGRKGEPIGTKKTWGGKEYVKTGSGWTPSKKAKAAHEVIHGKKEENKVDLNKEIETAKNKFSHVTKQGKNINIIQHKNGDINYNFHNNHKVGDTKHEDGSDMSGKVIHVIEGDKNPIMKPVDLSGARSGAKTNAEIAEANRTREKREYGEELKAGDDVIVNPDHPEVEFRGKVIASNIYGVKVDTGNGRPSTYSRADVISAEKHNASKKDKPNLNEEEKRHYDYLVDRFNKVDDAAKKRMVDNSKNYIEVAKQFDEDNSVKDSDTDPRVIASKQFVKDFEQKVEGIKDRSKLFAVGTPARTEYNGREVSGEVVMNKIAMWYPEKGENRELYVAGTLKGLSLYRDSNYSGSSERFIVPDWNKVKSFYEK